MGALGGRHSEVEAELLTGRAFSMPSISPFPLPFALREFVWQENLLRRLFKEFPTRERWVSVAERIDDVARRGDLRREDGS